MRNYRKLDEADERAELLQHPAAHSTHKAVFVAMLAAFVVSFIQSTKRGMYVMRDLNPISI